MAASTSLLRNSWDECKNLISMRWQTYAWYIVLSYVLTGVALFLMGWLVYPTVQSFVNHFPEIVNKTFDPATLMLPNFALIGLIGLVMILVGAILKFGFYRVAVDKKGEQTVGAILSRGIEHYFWTFFVSIAAGILVAIVVIVGTIALILPGIYLGIGLAFTGFIIILDGKGPVESMSASRAMVRGRWWSVFGTMLFWFLVAVIVSMLGSFVFNLIFASLLHVQTMDSLSSSLGQAMAQAQVSGNFDQVTSIASQMLAQFVNVKTVAAFGVDVFFQSAFMIVSYYGILGTYLALKKMK